MTSDFRRFYLTDPFSGETVGEGVVLSSGRTIVSYYEGGDLIIIETLANLLKMLDGITIDWIDKEYETCSQS